MGQYFRAICPDRGECIVPWTMGSGAKIYEIAHSGIGVLDAMAVLIADPGRGRRKPGDGHLAGKTGLWAGERAFFIGDYAGDGDMAGWHWSISEGEMYAHISENGRDMGADALDHVARMHGCMIQRQTVVRTDQDGKVVSRNVHPHVIVLDDDEGERLRVDLSKAPRHLFDVYEKAAARAARMRKARHAVRADTGHRRLLADLDRREYVDPRQLAEIPTLVGILRGHLKHWDEQAGAPLSDDYPITTLRALVRLTTVAEGDGTMHDGLWRGNRILLTAERSDSHPATDEIESDPNWRDITGELIAETPAIDWSVYHERVARQRCGRISG